MGQGFLAPNPFGNTTIAVVATNASLTKVQVNKVAQMAHDGIAQAIRPPHTMFDGDTIFALALGPQSQTMTNPALPASQVSMIGAAPAITLARAILKPLLHPPELHGSPPPTSSS